MQVLEHLFMAVSGRLLSHPTRMLYAYRGECAAVLAPVENGGLRLLAPATFLVAGNLSVRLKKPAGDVFVWKKKEIPATEERLKQLEEFRTALMEILEMPAQQ